MAGFSTYWQQKVLDHSTGKTDIGTLPTVHIALFTANPTDGGGGTECNYTGYARSATSGATWNAASGTSVSNASPVGFPLCTAGTNAVTAFGAFDAASGGNMLWWGTCSLAVSAGITPSFGAGALVVTAD